MEEEVLEGTVSITCKCVKTEKGYINTVNIDCDGDSEIYNIIVKEIESKSQPCRLSWFEIDIEEALCKEYPESI